MSILKILDAFKIFQIKDLLKNVVDIVSSPIHILKEIWVATFL